jgi:hypothetical protein
MLKHQRQRYEMFLRVRDFGTEHQPVFPATSAAGQAFAAVTEAAAAIEHQSAARLVNAQAGKKALAASRKAVRNRLKAIARTARRVGETEPAARDVFQLPARTSDHALLEAARAFVRDGEAASARWVPLGLPETTIAELREAMETFARAVDGRRQGKSSVAAAREAVTEALARGFEAVRELDVIVANTLEPDSPIAAAWKRARRMQSSARVAANEAEPPTTATGPSAEAASTTPAALGTVPVAEANPSEPVTAGDPLRKAS